VVEGWISRLQLLVLSTFCFLPSDFRGPRRLARPRTSPFHGGNAGSNPAGDANILKYLLRLTLSPGGSKGFDKEGTLNSVHLLDGLSRQNHSDDFGLCFALRRGHRLRVNVGGHTVIGMA
jgi:hypothetical protein